MDDMSDLGGLGDLGNLVGLGGLLYMSALMRSVFWTDYNNVDKYMAQLFPVCVFRYGT